MFHFFGVTKEKELLPNNWYPGCNLMRVNPPTRSEIPVHQHIFSLGLPQKCGVRFSEFHTHCIWLLICIMKSSGIRDNCPCKAWWISAQRSNISLCWFQREERKLQDMFPICYFFPLGFMIGLIVSLLPSKLNQISSHGPSMKTTDLQKKLKQNYNLKNLSFRQK